jgi:hypothetical protein
VLAFFYLVTPLRLSRTACLAPTLLLNSLSYHTAHLPLRISRFTVLCTSCNFSAYHTRQIFNSGSSPCITPAVDACPDQTRSPLPLSCSHRVAETLFFRMPFFTSPGQEVYEHRLKRSSSLTSVRTRSRQTSGAPKSPLPSHTHTRSVLLPILASDDALAPYLLPSPILPPLPSPVPATYLNLNEPDHGTRTNLFAFDSLLIHQLCLATKGPKLLPQGSVPGQDSLPLRVPPSVNDPELGQHPNTSSPSHSRRDFDSGSVSDSGVTSRPPRSPRRFNLSSPLPHNVHLSPPSAQHHPPSSPNLPIAGYFSDGERSLGLLHPSRLDVKRLLSKPAAPSVNSTLSITSGSESNALPRVHPNSNEAWPSKTRMQVHFQPTNTPPTESTEQRPTSPQPSLQQRPRNLFRKRSGSKQARAAVSATLPSKATTSSALQPTIRSPAAASPRSEFSTTTLQFVIASRSTVTASAPPRGSSGKLTPAGAIAQAYKEQDIRREALATATRVETVVPASGSQLCVPDPPTYDASVASTSNPGFGSSPDRIVGSVEDKSHDAGSGSHSASASVSQPIKSLTRKVSARFRRGRPSVSKDDDTESAHGDKGDGEHELPPLSEDPPSRHRRQRSASFPKLLRLSLDQHNVAAPSGGSLNEHSHRPTPDVVGPLSAPARSKGKQKLREDDTGAGGRLWRLVKRISAAGLRERFHTTGEPVPPVPTVPSLVPSTTTVKVKMPITASGSGGPEPGATTDPHPSTSTVRPGRPSMSCGTPSQIPSTPQGPGTILRHPSVSSSSPQSSEPTSTHFFRSHSSRSSFSSIFCSSSPPPPVSVLAQNPSPRTRLRAKSNSSSPATRPSCDEPPSKSPRVRTRKQSSPDIPSFSVSEVVNSFIARRPSLVRRPSNSRHQQQQRQNTPAQSTPEETSTLPPRPARSELRNAVGPGERDHPKLSGPSVLSHDSQSSSSTERAGSTSASTISAHAVAGAGSVAQMTFREIGGTQRQAWTSQEKEDKWDDLLKKSARAGGTLHLGGEGAGLPSDNLRFSSSTLPETESQI